MNLILNKNIYFYPSKMFINVQGRFYKFKKCP